MAVKKKVAHQVTQTRKKVSHVISQAKESLKLLEAIEKEALQKAKTFVRNPLPGDRKKLTNDKIVASLKKLGIATREEVDTLRLRVEKLEAQLAARDGTSSSTMPNA